MVSRGPDPVPAAPLPTNLPDLWAALRTTAGPIWERDAINLVIVAGWAEDPGFRQRCLEPVSRDRARVRWSQVQPFIRDQRLVDHGAVTAAPCGAILVRAYTLATGGIAEPVSPVARFVPLGDLVYIVCSDGTTMVAANEADARELVPDGCTVIESPSGPGAA